MNQITTVGLDLAKRVVSLCGEDASGRVVVQRTLRREAVLGWFAQRAACLVGMEACASAHWSHHPTWRHLSARTARARGTLRVAGGFTHRAAPAKPHCRMDRRHLRTDRLPQDAGRGRQQARAANLGTAHPRRTVARARRRRLIRS